MGESFHEEALLLEAIPDDGFDLLGVQPVDHFGHRGHLLHLWADNGVSRIRVLIAEPVGSFRDGHLWCRGGLEQASDQALNRLTGVEAKSERL